LTAISKIQETIRYIKSTPSRKQQFKEAIEMTNAPNPNQALPSVDVPTRWNSTFLMLKSVIPYKEVLDYLSIQDANYTDCPSLDEWEEIFLMKDFLAIFNTGMFYMMTLTSF